MSSLTTDANGRAVFTGISSGGHSVTVSDTGFKTQTASFTVSGDMEEDIDLAPGTTTDNTALIIAAVAITLGGVYLLGRRKHG